MCSVVYVYVKRCVEGKPETRGKLKNRICITVSRLSVSATLTGDSMCPRVIYYVGAAPYTVASHEEEEYIGIHRKT